MFACYQEIFVAPDLHSSWQSRTYLPVAGNSCRWEFDCGELWCFHLGCWWSSESHSGAPCRCAWSAASQGSQSQEGSFGSQVKLGAMEYARGSMHSFALKLLLCQKLPWACGFFENAYLSSHETFESPVWGLQPIQRFWEKMVQLHDVFSMTNVM